MDTTLASAKSAGFWHRQFQSPWTLGQRVFDVVFGILVPVFCVIEDPTVFRGDAGDGRGLLSEWSLFGYLEIAIGISVLGYYVIARRASLVVSGILHVGAVFSFLLGLVLLPISLIGLVILIGVFGFMPFFSCFVYLRNGYRCWREAAAGMPSRKAALTPALAISLTICLPLALQVSTSHIIRHALLELQSDSEDEFRSAVRTLKYGRFIARTDEIVSLYQETKDQRKQERLAH